MQNTKEILDTIRQSKQHLTSMYKLREVGVFGSVIRGEQRDGSDIDVLVDLRGKEGRPLFCQLIEIELGATKRPAASSI